ncbi:BtpA/SgcQ family protein [Clostridium minihomine]|uniref:BtpA/SgcQ family protein n=1 Tax=Clostridium minihomine TaxID=2045012 RepID=UPI000C7806E2|nr:BtpA/SgcQ family protein [Clostridium minihomine]
MSKLDFSAKERGLILGMVHCLPLPGTARYGGDMDKIVKQAVQDAVTLEKAGVDAIIVENMGDDPFYVELETAQSTALAAVSMAVRQSVALPIGIDAAMSDFKSAISIAQAIGGDFVRIPVFVDTVHYGGCGIIEPCAAEAMRYRKLLGAEHIQILADIQVKHTTMVLSGVSLEDSARDARDSGADALIVTGSRIGQETPIEMIRRVKKVVNIPVLAGSGVNKGNVKEQMQIADGAIIGSALKEGGVITNPVSFELTKELTDALR